MMRDVGTILLLGLLSSSINGIPLNADQQNGEAGVEAFQVVQAAQSPSSSTQEPSVILDRIKRDAQGVEQLRVALESPDPSVRVAAFNAMVNSGNPAWSEFAITTAFSSADQTMRALAFRAAFKAVSAFHVDLEAEDNTSQKDAPQYEVPLSETIREYFYESGKFKPSSATYASGQVSGDVIMFKTSRCSGRLSNKEGTWVFHGAVSCQDRIYRGTFVLR